MQRGESGRSCVHQIGVSDAGYFAESRGLVSGPKFSVPQSLRSAVAEVDTGTNAIPDPEREGDEGNAQWPTDGALVANLRKFANPELTNATTTTCDKCHNTLNVRRSAMGKYALSGTREEGAYLFHMLRGGGGGPELNLRTVTELDLEFKRVNAELRGMQ